MAGFRDARICTRFVPPLRGYGGNECEWNRDFASRYSAALHTWLFIGHRYAITAEGRRISNLRFEISEGEEMNAEAYAAPSPRPSPVEGEGENR
jgi:hypothetical protein